MSNSARLNLWHYAAIEGIAAFACSIFQNGIFFWAAARHGFSPALVLLLGAVQGLAYMVSAKAGGARAARFGYDRVLQLTMVGTAATALALLWVDGRWVPFVMMGVFIAFTGPFWPSLEAALLHAPSRLSTPQRLGLYNLTWAFTSSAGFFTCGWIITHGLDAVIWLPAVVMFSMIVFFVLPRRAAAEGAETPVAHDANAGLDGATKRRFAHLHWLGNSQAYFVMTAFSALLPFIAQRLELDARGVIWLTCALYFSRALSFVVLTRWEGWHYRAAWSHACIALTPACGAVLLLAPSVAAVLAACVVFGAVLGLAYSGSLYYSMNVGDNKGEHGGLHESIIGGGILLGPLVGAGGAAVFGLNGASLVVIAASVLIGIGGTWLVGSIFRRSRS